MLQRKSSFRGNVAEVPPIVHDVLRSTGQPLDASTRHVMEPRFGHDFSHVRVHTDARAAESARAVNALAYTVGSNVVFDSARYAPGTSQGQRLIAHELTHVVQQSMVGGGASTSPTAAEREADLNGERVGSSLAAKVGLGAAPGTVQREEKDKKKEPEGEFSTESEGTKKATGITNKIGYSAELTLPVLPGWKLGRLTLLDNVKLKTEGSGEKESQPGQPASLPTGADIDTFNNEVTLGVLGLQLPKLLNDQLTLGTSLEAFGKQQFKLDEISGAAGATAKIEAAFKSKSLLSPRYGDLTLGSKLTFKGTAEQSFGKETKFIPKASATAAIDVGFKSRPLGGPFPTFFGLLGDKARITAGVEGSFSPSYDPEKGLTSKLAGAATLGLVGTGEAEPFIKAKIGGELYPDLQKRTIDSNLSAQIFTISAGFKFGGGDKEKRKKKTEPNP